ncbi:hypothetical protein GBO66_09905 [Pediococcus acidilactici]|uniref:hypothetical protein n=1 Tax=Pediococcus acidilactici TaxID=1254 RepID=UPI0013302324|nr:hypothetical protein [Pediococcus acidilactici]KAF0387775.1 hypothetical protein GBO66_09905 [Pediococcus acidilactici]KAF0802255.1 hypothetical protein GBP45_06055 [Pediococcus acidilactici]
MKMVKISEYLYLNSDFIESIEADSEESVIITMTSGGIFGPNVSIKKILDTINGSGEHSIEYEDDNSYRQDNHYRIIINNDHAGAEVIVTKSELLSLLDQLKNDETLTIKRSK